MECNADADAASADDVFAVALPGSPHTGNPCLVCSLISSILQHGTTVQTGACMNGCNAVDIRVTALEPGFTLKLFAFSWENKTPNCSVSCFFHAGKMGLMI